MTILTRVAKATLTFDALIQRLLSRAHHKQYRALVARADQVHSSGKAKAFKKEVQVLSQVRGRQAAALAVYHRSLALIDRDVLAVQELHSQCESTREHMHAVADGVFSDAVIREQLADKAKAVAAAL